MVALRAAGKRPTAQRLPRILLLFVLVPFLLEAAGVFWPAIQGLFLSLIRWDGVGPATSVGLANFHDLLSDDVFLTALRNTAVWLVAFGGLSLVLGLGVALLLQAERRGVAVYRALFFAPIVFSLVVTALVWRVMYQPDGVINTLLGLVGLRSWQHLWLADPDTALYALIVAALWRSVGYVMVLYLAGLKAIDPTLNEAARVDGASVWQRFRFITVPSLRSVNSVVVSVIVIDCLRSFDIVYSLTSGGPYHSTELLSTYMYSTAFQGRQLGYASAIAVVIFLLSVTFIVVYLVRILKDDSQ